MSRVAVIIPVCNAEDTLPQVLDSLKLQTLRDYTAIFIDDESSDRSADIIQRAANSDERLVLLKSKRGGPGAARNIGLDKADKIEAEFIAFLDADDYFTADALETAVSLLEENEADIVHFPWASTGSALAGVKPLSQPSIYVWNKVYRRSIVVGIRFQSARFAEDLAYFLETEARNPKRIGCSRGLYVHVKRASSLWESRSPGDIINAMLVIAGHLSDFFAANSHISVAEDWKAFYLIKLLKQWWRAIRRLPRTARERQKSVFVNYLKQLRSKGQIPFFCVQSFRFRFFCHVLLIYSPIAEVSRWMHQKYFNLVYRCRYTRQLRRLRKTENCPIKVLFLVSEISKWKTRSLFEFMTASSNYKPIVAVGLDECEMRHESYERRRLIESRMNWFRQRGFECQSVFDLKSCAPVNLRKLKPDIVFYQQPWQLPKPHRPACVSRFALTFYVPYCLADFGNLQAECLMPFFRQIFVYFVQNRDWASLYRIASDKGGCRFVATGNPIIDCFGTFNEPKNEGEYVIYAPHWTFRHPGQNDLYPYGTFDWNGREILEYAKQHPEWKWVFKPHPLLRAALVEHGLMSQSSVDAYYAEWERIGNVCYDADYPSLFIQSRAMITDSGSFLVEYGATGCPLIHLKPYDSQVELLPPNRALFESYYSVTNLNEMARAFSEVLERRIDPFGDRRREACQKAGLFDRNASKKILQYLNKILKKEDEKYA